MKDLRVPFQKAYASVKCGASNIAAHRLQTLGQKSLGRLLLDILRKLCRHSLFGVACLLITSAHAQPTRVKQVVTAFIENAEGKVLLLERSKSEPLYPEYFSLPGGRPNGREPLRRAIRREVREETGLNVRVLGIYNRWSWISIIAGEEVLFEVTSYKVEPLRWREVRLSSEHTSYIWTDLVDLLKIKVSPELVADLKVAYQRKPCQPALHGHQRPR